MRDELPEKFESGMEEREGKPSKNLSGRSDSVCIAAYTEHISVW